MFKLGSINDLLQGAGQYIRQRAVQDTERLADLNDGFWGAVAQGSRYVDDALQDVGEAVYSGWNGKRFAPGEFASSFRDVLDSGAQALGNAGNRIAGEINRGAAVNRMRRGVDLADYNLDDFQRAALDIARNQFGLSDYAAHLAATSNFNPRVLRGYLDEGELRVLEESYRLGKGAVMSMVEEARRSAPSVRQVVAEEAARMPTKVQDVFTGGYNTAPDFEAEMFQQLGTQATSRANAQDLGSVFTGQGYDIAPSRPVQISAPPAAMTRQEFNPSLDESRYDSVPRQNPEAPIRYFDELDEDDRKMAALERFLKRSEVEPEGVMEPELLSALQAEKLRRIRGY